MLEICSKMRDASFMAMLSGVLCSFGGILKLPNNAKYKLEDVINVLLYASNSTSNSIEAAVSDIAQKNEKIKIPSADTVHGYVKTNKIEDILSFFRDISSDLLKLVIDPNKRYDVAIDFHNIGYYGEKNTQGIRGIKAKNGTSWGYSYLTIDLIGICKFTPDIINIGGLSKNYSILIESILIRVQSMGIKLNTLFLDREFFNLPVIGTLHKINAKYVMPAKENKKIKKLIEDLKKKYGRATGVIKYRFEDANSPEFYLVIIKNPKYDPNNKKSREYFLFATNINFGSVAEFISRVPEEYRKRWNIETGYRVKNEFKIRTCSKSPVTRVLLFVIQCVMYNFLCMLKSVCIVKVDKLKSIIIEDILDIFKITQSQQVITIKDFLIVIMKYNENRDFELNQRLKPKSLL